MAGWSMVADEDTAVDFCKTPKSLEPTANNSPEAVSHREADSSILDTNINELVSLFRRLLDSFLVEFCSPDSFLPLPPMTGDGRAVDLFVLFVNVSHRGGFDSVNESSSWGDVGQESGLGLNSSAFAKLIYVKYLDAIARWLNRVVAVGCGGGGGGSDDTTIVELSGISDQLMSRLKEFLSQVKRKFEMRNGAAPREFGAELKWFVSKTKRRYDEKRRVGNEGSKATDKKLEKLMIKDCSSPGKRKRECSLETLRWLSKAAKDPSHTSIGRLPDRSKWESYGSEEPWKQLLLFRASRTTADSACGKIWQKIQKMHPSLYEDSAGPSYNLRERLRCDGSQFNDKKSWNGKMSCEDGSASDSSDDEDRPRPRVGSEYQAEVPEWTGVTSEGDSKWLGTRIWPLSKEQNNNNVLIERDPIGKGRQDPCGCQYPGSVDCVRFHISTKQEKLKLEIGSAFYMSCFDTMGEGTLQYWTDLELKKLKSLMPFPPTLSPSFFAELKRLLPSKSRGQIVSYFYNVSLLQFRANQSRMTHEEVDSDTDQLYNLDPTLEANTSQKPVLLTPKKKRRR